MIEEDRKAHAAIDALADRLAAAECAAAFNKRAEGIATAYWTDAEKRLADETKRADDNLNLLMLMEERAEKAEREVEILRGEAPNIIALALEIFEDAKPSTPEEREALKRALVKFRQRAALRSGEKP